MKITEVETFVLTDRRMLVKISSDTGVSGWGEPVLEGWVPAVRGAIERIREHLIGRDPRQTIRLWQLMARGGFYRDGAVLASAVAGLDQALWDLKARWHGVPIYEMLGGPCRDRVRVYAHANIWGRTGDPVRARELVAAGITMIKVAPEGPRAFLDSPAAVEQFVADLTELREVVGAEVDIAVDLHGRFSVANAVRVLPLVEPLLLSFIEEPVRPELTHRIGDVVRATSTPIATGERLFSCADFLPAFDAGIAVAQPDISHAGGITEGLRIAALADVHDVAVAPHCPLGPVALSACLQLAMAVENFFVQEQTLKLHDPAAADLTIVSNPGVFRLVDGYLPRLTGPGLGVDIDEDAVRAAVIPEPIRGGTPIWDSPDGSFTEW